MKQQRPPWFTESTPGYNDTKEIHTELLLARKARAMIANRKKWEESLVPWFRIILLRLGFSRYSNKMRSVQKALHTAESKIMSKAHQLFLKTYGTLGWDNQDPERFKKFNDFCLAVGALDPHSEVEIELMTGIWGQHISYFKVQTGF